nr:2'-deoxycytidine 5'-triphosphate deaminase [Gammaproteobacteria bacterium]
MILSDRNVKELLRDKRIEIIPSPKESDWQNMTLEGHLSNTIFRIKSRAPGGGRIAIDLIDYKTEKFAENFWEEVDPTPDGYFPIHPGEFRLAYTEEKVKLPHESHVCAFVEGKSGIARIGLGVHFAPIIHCGFGKNEALRIMLELYNHSQSAIYLRPGQSICQFMFATIDGEGISSGANTHGVKQPEP